MFICKESELPAGSKKVVMYDGNKVAVFNIGGEYFAVKDACPHMGDSLSRGRLEGEIICCSGHNWQFDLRTGACIKGNKDISLKLYKVEIKNEELLIHSF